MSPGKETSLLITRYEAFYQVYTLSLWDLVHFLLPNPLQGNNLCTISRFSCLNSKKYSFFASVILLYPPAFDDQNNVQLYTNIWFLDSLKYHWFDKEAIFQPVTLTNQKIFRVRWNCFIMFATVIEKGQYLWII